MKLYSQHGHADGQKTLKGFEGGSLNGVIYSPKDISLENLEGAIQKIKNQNPSAECLFDPQVYASFLATQSDSRMGFLLDGYSRPDGYFNARRRSQFESEIKVKEQIKRTLSFQMGFDLAGLISPNIYISDSCNSIEAAISKTFLRLAKPVAEELGSELPIFATLAISRDALINIEDFLDFLSDLTIMDQPPDGFYILVGVSKPDARSEIFNSEVLAGWMLMNWTFSQNGFRVINGYSDFLTPFLGMAGGEAGASGWWSNLKVFSLDRFSPTLPGGSLPVVRYLSKNLLGRITYFELEQIRNFFPSILNGLDTDNIYTEHDEPARREEVLQTWQTIQNLNANLLQGNIGQRIERCRLAINNAVELREQIRRSPIRLENKSDGSHLDPLFLSLRRFTELAELS